MVLIGICISGIFRAIIRIMENTVENIEQTTAPKGSESYWLRMSVTWGIFGLLAIFLYSGVELAGFPMFFMVPFLLKALFGSKARMLKGKELREKMARTRVNEMTSPIYSSLPSNTNYKSDH